jgi:hypothetical protein
MWEDFKIVARQAKRGATKELSSSIQLPCLHRKKTDVASLAETHGVRNGMVVEPSVTLIWIQSWAHEQAESHENLSNRAAAMGGLNTNRMQNYAQNIWVFMAEWP